MSAGLLRGENTGDRQFSAICGRAATGRSAGGGRRNAPSATGAGFEVVAGITAGHPLASPHLYKSRFRLRGNIGRRVGSVMRASGRNSFPLSRPFPRSGRPTPPAGNTISTGPGIGSVLGVTPLNRCGTGDTGTHRPARAGRRSHSAAPASAPRATAGILVYDATGGDLEPPPDAGRDRKVRIRRAAPFRGHPFRPAGHPNGSLSPARPQRRLLVGAQRQPITLAQLDRRSRRGSCGTPGPGAEG